MKSIFSQENEERSNSLFTKIKDWVVDHQNDIILVAGVILISLLSFAMGYIFAKQQDKPSIRFETTSQIQ